MRARCRTGHGDGRANDRPGFEPPCDRIVFANASLAPIEMKQRVVTCADAAVDFPGTDYTKVARALSGKQLCLLQPGNS